MLESIFALLKWLSESGLLAVSVALIGWFFVYRNSRALQKRSESWAIIKNISDTLKNIESTTQDFWLPESELFVDPMIFQSKINADLTDVQRWISLLENRIKLSDEIQTVLTHIFQNTTYDIENVKSIPASQRIRVVQLVHKRTNHIKMIIDGKYHASYL
ncbi:hypothetical protein MASR2M36_18250 [Providencia sp.]